MIQLNQVKAGTESVAARPLNIALLAPSPCPDLIVGYGLRILSACLKRAGHKVRVLFLPREPGYIHAECELADVVEFCRGAELIGISLMTDDLDVSVMITKALKTNLDAPVIWGGVHPTFDPMGSIEHADMVCMGEAEESLVEVAARVAAGKPCADIPGIWTKEGGTVTKTSAKPIAHDLDSLPFPDYDVQDHTLLLHGKIRSMDGDEMKHFLGAFYLTLTSRGCPCECTFCWNEAINNMFPTQKKIRKRGIANVIAELTEVKAKFPYVNLVCFDDDAFFMRPTREIVEFAKLYKEHVGIPMWITGAFPTSLSREKLEPLVDAGMMSIRMGIQTGSPKIKKLFERDYPNEMILERTKLIHSFVDKIPLPQYDFIIDNPWEERENVRETLMFMAKIPVPYEVFLFPLSFYPGTALAVRAKKEGKDFTSPEDLKRLAHAGFRDTHLNRVILMMCEYARMGKAISERRMSLLTNEFMEKVGLAQLLYKWMWKKVPAKRREKCEKQFFPVAPKSAARDHGGPDLPGPQGKHERPEPAKVDVSLAVVGATPQIAGK